MPRVRKQINQINVVPYIDVMLVLLIIFMITAPLINPGQVELPSIGKSQDTPLQPVEVQVKANGDLWVRDTSRQAAPQPVSRDELLALIRDMKTRNPDQPVVIAGDKAVKYDEVLKIMDLLQQNQVKRIGLLVKPKT